MNKNEMSHLIIPDAHKSLNGYLKFYTFTFLGLFFFLYICSLSIQIDTSIYKFIFLNSSNDPLWQNNRVVETGSNISINLDKGNCTTNYKEVGCDCIRSHYGLFLPGGCSTKQTITSTLRASDFDQDVNSFLLRIYFNPTTTHNTKHHEYFILHMTFNNDSKIFIKFKLYTLFSNNGTNSYVIIRDGYNLPNYEYESSCGNAPLIYSSTWVDISVTYIYNKNSRGYLYFSEKIYSSGKLHSYSEPTSYDNPDASIQNLSEVKLSLNVPYEFDSTIQYIEIFGARKSYEDISKALSFPCNEGNFVPPEYCSDASNYFLKKGCTSAVGMPCSLECQIGDKLVSENESNSISNSSKKNTTLPLNSTNPYNILVPPNNSSFPNSSLPNNSINYPFLPDSQFNNSNSSISNNTSNFSGSTPSNNSETGLNCPNGSICISPPSGSDSPILRENSNKEEVDFKGTNTFSSYSSTYTTSLMISCIVIFPLLFVVILLIFFKRKHYKKDDTNKI